MMRNPERMEEALRLIAATRDGRFECESFTTGIGSCERNGRTKDAEFGADRWCNACTAYWGLSGGFPSHIEGR